jgi:hypothetical protein
MLENVQDLPNFKLFLTVIGAAWVFVTFVVNERRANGDWILKIFEQLDRHGDVIRENYELQKYFSDTHAKPIKEFKENGSIARDELFFKAKTMVYSNLNIFDSFVSRTTRTWPLWRLLVIPNHSELKNWDVFIIYKMKHPFFRAVLEEERAIFGDALWKFYEERVRPDTNSQLQYLW